jgi:ABC-type taurine transport system ATPase subunit
VVASKSAQLLHAIATLNIAYWKQVVLKKGVPTMKDTTLTLVWAVVFSVGDKDSVWLGPKILLLDEATAVLDNESEKIVQAALDRMQEANARATLVVAHRLETVKKCNKIVVLDGGGVKKKNVLMTSC